MIKQAGFSFIEIIVAVIVLAMIGGGAYLYFSQHQITSLTYQAPSKSSNLTPTPISTANWKTYTAPYTSGSFKYPPSWTITKLTSENLNAGTDETPVYEDIFILESPSKIQFTYDVGISGIGGTCGGGFKDGYYTDQNDKPVFSDNVLAISQLPNDAYKMPLYEVFHSRHPVGGDEQPQIMVSTEKFSVGDRVPCAYGDLFESPYSSAAQPSLALISIDNKGTQKLNDAQFKDNPDVKVAQQILQTLQFFSTGTSSPN